MPKARVSRTDEAIGIMLKPGLQVRRTRLVNSGKIGREEIHFLCHAALDDFVVAIESKSDSFAKKYLLRYLLFHQDLHLRRRWQ